MKQKSIEIKAHEQPKGLMKESSSDNSHSLPSTGEVQAAVNNLLKEGGESIMKSSESELLGEELELYTEDDIENTDIDALLKSLDMSVGEMAGLSTEIFPVTDDFLSDNEPDYVDKLLHDKYGESLKTVEKKAEKPKSILEIWASQNPERTKSMLEIISDKYPQGKDVAQIEKEDPFANHVEGINQILKKKNCLNHFFRGIDMYDVKTYKCLGSENLLIILSILNRAEIEERNPDNKHSIRETTVRLLIEIHHQGLLEEVVTKAMNKWMLTAKEQIDHLSPIKLLSVRKLPIGSIVFSHTGEEYQKSVVCDHIGNHTIRSKTTDSNQMYSCPAKSLEIISEKGHLFLEFLAWAKKRTGYERMRLLQKCALHKENFLNHAVSFFASNEFMLPALEKAMESRVEKRNRINKILKS